MRERGDLGGQNGHGGRPASSDRAR
jgi:hypothetical protein